MKIIIMAGGDQKRYAPPTPKQFIRIDGERIIERSIKLFRDYGDVYVIAENPEFNYLEELGCTVVTPSEKSHELSKFASSYDIWKDSEEVIFIWGDSYIGDATARRIKETPKHNDFTFYGTDWEFVALRINKSEYTKFMGAINYIKILQDRGEGGLCGSWTLYRLLLGKDLITHKHYTNLIKIEDESTDFDAEHELYEWHKKHPEHTVSLT